MKEIIDAAIQSMNDGHTTPAQFYKNYTGKDYDMENITREVNAYCSANNIKFDDISNSLSTIIKNVISGGSNE
ncbi:MAG TPA: hypothetical protein DDW62_08570 [Marinilabiliaceae bacterium]|nr:hypothetical protein [Marinilabiliaceae bacterium]